MAQRLRDEFDEAITTLAQAERFPRQVDEMQAVLAAFDKETQNEG